MHFLGGGGVTTLLLAPEVVGACAFMVGEGRGCVC